jgi:hypothetical protein
VHVQCFLQDATKRHTLDRKQVTEVICALCGTRQPVAASCSSCGVQFGRYACLKCNFFDDTTSKLQFHCDECGICRVGGRSNFFHCSTCNCCYSTSLQGSHVCVSNSMHQVRAGKVCQKWMSRGCGQGFGHGLDLLHSTAVAAAQSRTQMSRFVTAAHTE